MVQPAARAKLRVVVRRDRRHTAKCHLDSMADRPRMRWSLGSEDGQTCMLIAVSSKKRLTQMYRFAINLAPVNLDRIQAWIDKGRLDPTKPITLRELSKSRCIHQAKDGVKLLAKGKEELRSKINIVVSRASAEAIKSIEETGGSVVTRFYSPFAIKKILGGQMDPLHSLQSRLHLDPTFASEAQTEYDYRLPDPVGRKDVEYYRDSANRGYLSYTVEEGQNPSLFFKAPGPWRRSLRLGADTALQQERAGDADGKPIEQSGAIATKLQRAAAKTEEKMW